MKIADKIPHLNRLLNNAVKVFVLSVMIISTHEWYDYRQVKKIRLADMAAERAVQAELDRRVVALADESFEDYMMYYRIFPPKKKVVHGEKIYMVSDSEVLKIGFTITWRETVQCDRNPYDGIESFEHYASVLTTSTYQGTLRPRPADGGIRLAGWPAREWRDNDLTYKNPSPILTYPEIDSDCRIKSVMVQRHIDARGHPHLKIMTMYSEPVKVRGF